MKEEEDGIGREVRKVKREEKKKGVMEKRREQVIEKSFFLMFLIN